MVSWCMPVTESMPVPYESDLVTEWWDNEPSGWVAAVGESLQPLSIRHTAFQSVTMQALSMHLKLHIPAQGQNNA